MQNSQLNTRPWHAESVEATCAALRTPPRGLTEQDVHRRQQEYGPNRLPEKELAPLWLIVGRQFVSPLIYILVAAAVVSVAIGDVKDAGFIAAVLAINAVIGAIAVAVSVLVVPAVELHKWWWAKRQFTASSKP